MIYLIYALYQWRAIIIKYTWGEGRFAQVKFPRSRIIKPELSSQVYFISNSTLFR